MNADPTTRAAQLLTFEACGEEYGVDLLQVTEIIEYGTLTQVPNMPPAVRGVVNLRGHVLPVIDLAARFGLPASPVTRRSCVVVVQGRMGGEATPVGVVADAVHEVVDVEEDAAVPPPAFGTTAGAGFLAAMVRRRERFVMVLELARVLDLDALPLELPVPAGAAIAEDTAA